MQMHQVLMQFAWATVLDLLFTSFEHSMFYISVADDVCEASKAFCNNLYHLQSILCIFNQYDNTIEESIDNTKKERTKNTFVYSTSKIPRIRLGAIANNCFFSVFEHLLIPVNDLSS